MTISSRVSSFFSQSPKTAIFFCVAVISLLYLGTIGKINSSLGDYGPQTESILNGHPFYSDNGVFLDSYPPVQPLLIVAQTWLAQLLDVNRILVVVFFNILFFCITATVLYDISCLMKVRRSVAIGLTLAFANPLTLFLLGLPASEDIYMLFYALSVKELTKIFDTGTNKKLLPFLAAGFWFGLAWLTRPISIFIPFCAVATMLLFSKANVLYYLKGAGLLLLVAFLTVSPWQFFTYQQSGKFHFLSSRGVNGLRDGLSNNSAAKTYRARFDYPADIDSMLSRFQANYDGYVESSQVIDFLRAEFEKNPGTVIRYYLTKAGRVFYGTDSHKVREESVIKFITLPFFFLYLCSVVLFTKKRKLYPVAFKITFFTFLATLSVWGIATICTSIVRYMVPVMLINALPASFILYMAVKKIKRFFIKGQ